MSDNAFAAEATQQSASANRGFWCDLPIPLSAFAPATAASSGLVDSHGSTATGFSKVLRITNLAADAATGRHIATLCLPQLVGGAAQLLQALNSASAGLGPAVEVQVLVANTATTLVPAAVNGLKATATWMEGYASTALWRQISGTTAVGALPAQTVAGTGLSAVDFRWVTIPLLQPSVPTSGSTNTAAQRDALNATLMNNNYPLPFSLSLTNAATVASTHFLDIAAVNLRFRRHASNRWSERGDGFSNGGVVGVATGITPTFPRPAVSATPVQF